MPTARTAAFAVGAFVTLAAVPNNKKLVLDSVTIDNQGAAGHTIYLRDSFTADPTIAAPGPGPSLPIRAQWTVGPLLTAAIPESELKDKEFFGALQCYADGAEPACFIIVDYHFA